VGWNKFVWHWFDRHFLSEDNIFTFEGYFSLLLVLFIIKFIKLTEPYPNWIKKSLQIFNLKLFSLREVSGELNFSLNKNFAMLMYVGRGMSLLLSLCLSGCHLCLVQQFCEARELRFCMHTPHLNTTKYSKRIFEILLVRLSYRVLGVTHRTMPKTGHTCLYKIMKLNKNYSVGLNWWVKFFVTL